MAGTGCTGTARGTLAAVVAGAGIITESDRPDHPTDSGEW